MQQYPLITIVGGSGFVGRHLVKLLASKGYRLRVLVRDCIAAEYLKTAGSVGQIVIEHADITRPQTLTGKFEGSFAVINLVSILYERGRQKFNSINTVGARLIAEQAKQAGVQCFIHISALGADRAKDTAYGRTKLAGEEAIRSIFPEATILRPSIIVGPEGGFFQRFARMSLISPVLPLLLKGKTRFQPVLVTDVTSAILACLTNPATRGNIYEIAGPKTYTFRQLLELMAHITHRKPLLISIPTVLARLKAFFLEHMPCPPLITRDQIKLLGHDNVAIADRLGLAELGITPAPIESQLPHYLARYIKD